MRRTTLFVLFDSLGWELIGEANFLADLARHRYRLRTVLGPTSASLPTLLTGAAPRDHGHWMPFSYAPDDSPFRRFFFIRHLPSRLARSPSIRRRIGHIIARRLRWSGDFDLSNVPLEILPFLDSTAKCDLFEPGALAPFATAVDRLREEQIPFLLSDPRATDAQNFERAGSALTGGQAPFVLLRARELDGVLCQAGPRSEAARQKLGWYEAEIRRLCEAAARDEALVRLYLGSGHGVTEVVETVDIQSRVEGTGLRLGSDYFAFYDATMARFWFADPPARHRIMGSLADVHRGCWLGDDQLRIEGVYFHDHRYGEAVFLLDPGVQIVPSYAAAQRLAATGGYHPDAPGSWGAFCANFPLEIPPRLIGDLSALILEGARWAAK